jgi:hypothetical protein
MENAFQSGVDVTIMAILAIASIGIFFFQKHKIAILEKSANLQDKHVDTYQKIVNIDEMQKAATFKANSILHDVMKNSEQFKSAVKTATNDIYGRHLNEVIFRLLVLIKHILAKTTMTDKGQEVLIKGIYPENPEWIVANYRKIQITTEIKKDRTE